MRQPFLCPVHLYARRQCTSRCLPARQELQRINNDYRAYWYDRRRGVKGYTPTEWRIRYGRLP